MGKVIELFGKDEPATRRAFDEFVHETVAEDVEAKLSMKAGPAFVGGDEFVEQWRDKLKSLLGSGRLEIPEERRLVGWTCDEVVDATAEYFGVNADSIRRGRRGYANLPRQVALLICIDNTAATGREIGETFGIQPSTVSVLGVAYRRQLPSERNTRKNLAGVRKRLGMVS